MNYYVVIHSLSLIILIRYYIVIYIVLQKWPWGYRLLPFWSLWSICLCLTLWAWQTRRVLPAPASTLWLLLSWDIALHMGHECGIDDGLQRQPIFTCHTSHIDYRLKARESTRLIFGFAAPSLLSDIHSCPWSYRNAAMVLCCWDGHWLHLPNVWPRVTVEQYMEITGFCLWD